MKDLAERIDEGLCDGCDQDSIQCLANGYCKYEENLYQMEMDFDLDEQEAHQEDNDDIDDFIDDPDYSTLEEE